MMMKSRARSKRSRRRSAPLTSCAAHSDCFLCIAGMLPAFILGAGRSLARGTKTIALWPSLTHLRPTRVPVSRLLIGVGDRQEPRFAPGLAGELDTGGQAVQAEAVRDGKRGLAGDVAGGDDRRGAD